MVTLMFGCSSDDSDDDGTGGSGGDGQQVEDENPPEDGPPTTDSPNQYGDVHEGQYHLGPVDFAETEWHNACAPEGGYRSALRSDTGLGGEYLAGVSGEFADNGGVCDACIQVTTGMGKTIVARVVTYGATNEPGDIDVSPSVYETLNQEEYPRSMSWEFASCPDTGNLAYEFQTGANVWWTSFWVRNQKVPLVKVEVQSTNHDEFFELRREMDGTLNDDGGFGEGEFTLRLTGMDGQVITDTFPSFEPGELIESTQQFD